MNYYRPCVNSPRFGYIAHEKYSTIFSSAGKSNFTNSGDAKWLRDWGVVTPLDDCGIVGDFAPIVAIPTASFPTEELLRGGLLPGVKELLSILTTCGAYSRELSLT